MMNKLKFRFYLPSDDEIYTQEEVAKESDLNLEFGSDGFILTEYREDGLFGNYAPVEFVADLFTGLTDTSGVDIFAGDIFSGMSKPFGPLIGEVKLGEYEDNEQYVHGVHFGWNVNGVPLTDLVADGLKVTGNIHQHKELLA